jgi:hypothetical protein
MENIFSIQLTLKIGLVSTLLYTPLPGAETAHGRRIERRLRLIGKAACSMLATQPATKTEVPIGGIADALAGGEKAQQGEET